MEEGEAWVSARGLTGNTLQLPSPVHCAHSQGHRQRTGRPSLPASLLSPLPFPLILPPSFPPPFLFPLLSPPTSLPAYFPFSTPLLSLFFPFPLPSFSPSPIISPSLYPFSSPLTCSSPFPLPTFAIQTHKCFKTGNRHPEKPQRLEEDPQTQLPCAFGGPFLRDLWRAFENRCFLGLASCQTSPRPGLCLLCPIALHCRHFSTTFQR